MSRRRIDYDRDQWLPNFVTGTETGWSLREPRQAGHSGNQDRLVTPGTKTGLSLREPRQAGHSGNQDRLVTPVAKPFGWTRHQRVSSFSSYMQHFRKCIIKMMQNASRTKATDNVAHGGGTPRDISGRVFINKPGKENVLVLR